MSAVLLASALALTACSTAKKVTKEPISITTAHPKNSLRIVANAHYRQRAVVTGSDTIDEDGHGELFTKDVGPGTWTVKTYHQKSGSSKWHRNNQRLATRYFGGQAVQGEDSGTTGDFDDIVVMVIPY